MSTEPAPATAPRTTSTASGHPDRLDLSGPAVHLRRPGQHADPRLAGRHARACRSRPSRSAPTRSRARPRRHLPAWAAARTARRPGRQPGSTPTAACTGRLNRGAAASRRVRRLPARRHLVLRQGRTARRPSACSTSPPTAARPARGRRTRRHAGPGARPAHHHRLREPRRPYHLGPGVTPAGSCHHRDRQQRDRPRASSPDASWAPTCTGPALARNPAIADLMLSAVTGSTLTLYKTAGPPNSARNA